MSKKMFNIIYTLFLIIPSFRFVIISAMGLGLGLGMALVVFQNPDTSFASPAVYETHKPVPNVTISEFKIPKLNISEEIQPEAGQPRADNTNILESETSEGLGIKKLAILETKNKNLIKNLEKVLLGEKLLVVGSNNGLYVFTAIETRVISKSELNRAINYYSEGLIIFGQKSFLKDEVVLVVAK